MMLESTKETEALLRKICVLCKQAEEDGVPPAHIVETMAACIGLQISDTVTREEETTSLMGTVCYVMVSTFRTSMTEKKRHAS